jgi:hypothetical protein
MKIYQRADPEPEGNRMPLSEQEQRLLDEMERNLYQNDADFVATVGGRRGKPNYRTVVIGILVAILGIATLVTGVVIHQPLIGVLGFAIMFAGVLLVIAPPRRLASAPTRPQAKSTTPRRTGSFMDGLNDRWDRRTDERGQ